MACLHMAINMVIMGVSSKFSKNADFESKMYNEKLAATFFDWPTKLNQAT
jgi:hypothetical protein